MFAAFAAILVTTYAIYAKHSGIPEIKTVLGGFVIRRFMGTWTLVIKSLGLVRLRTRLNSSSVADESNSAWPWHLDFGWAKKDHWSMWRAAVPTC